MTSPQHLRLWPTPPRKPRISGDLPDLTMGAPLEFAYSVWGLGPLITSIVSGVFPEGLTLHADGTVTGAASTPGFYSWRARVMQGNALYDEVDDTAVVDAAIWLAGPVALNDAAGGSQNYYKKTQNIHDWSAAPVALPLGRTNLKNITVANYAAFMMFDGQNSAVSFDGADFWQSCDVELPPVPVYWSGTHFVCGTYMSEDGISWEVIPNLSGVPDFTVAREMDGVIICAYSDEPTHFEYTLDLGETWVSKDAPGGTTFYSLIVSKDMERINFGTGSPSTPNIAQYISDDLFESSSAVGSNRYHGKYGCSRLLVRGYPNTLEVTTDGGWSWNTCFGTQTSNNLFTFLDFGQNTWGVIHRTTVGTVQQFVVRISEDGGLSWVTGPTLYGSVQSIAFVGLRGDCSLYETPGYSLFTNYRVFGGTPDSAHFIASHNWDSSNVTVSRDGKYVLNAATTSAAEVFVYERMANGLGFKLLPNFFGTHHGTNGTQGVSYDNQYFAAMISGTSTFVVMRLVDDVVTELVTPGTPDVNHIPWFHPSRNVMFCRWDTGLRAYDLSGNTITQQARVATNWYPMRVGFSQVDPDVLVINTNVDTIHVVDISDPSGSMPILATVSGSSSNGGSTGIYFSADGSHIITVDLQYIHTRSWNKATGAIGSPVQLLATGSSRILDCDLSKDHRYLVEVGDIAAPYISIHHLSADGASILSSYDPPGSDLGQNNTVAWVDF